MVVGLLFQYILYFWGGSQLAKAKGYPNAILIWGMFCTLSQLVVLAVLLFALPDKCPNPSDQMRKRRTVRNESQIGRIVRYRKNALVANTLGGIGILLALFIGFVRTGLFEQYDNARITAIFIFLPSYVAVISGCWWWVRAKNWHEAVIFIGLMPLAILAIPYVRLIYRLVPMLLPASMVVMPIILLGVVAVLPDKSGMPKRKRWDRD